MGDRANVYIKQSADHGVYLYTHWGGTELPVLVQTSLRRAESRWGDDAYLARAIFSDMIQGHERDLTGFGISAFICDNEHPIIIVDSDQKMVGFAPEPEQDNPSIRMQGGGQPEMLRSWSFEDFTRLKPAEIEQEYEHFSELVK